jgi:hypothetical protein
VTAQGVRTARTGTSVPSDDTGAYRVYGLPPGQYYISVNDPSANRIVISPDGSLSGVLDNLQAGVVNIQAVEGASFAVSARDVITGSGGNTTSYAPTYYPGTASLAEAQRLNLGLGGRAVGHQHGDRPRARSASLRACHRVQRLASWGVCYAGQSDGTDVHGRRRSQRGRRDLHHHERTTGKLHTERRRT